MKRVSSLRQENYKSGLVRKLIELNLKLKAAKPLYAQYDELLEKVLAMGDAPKQVTHKGVVWSVRVVDGFGTSNTQWKSVAHRRFDLSVVPIGESRKKRGA